ncbi:unnamed protein product [[Candida] boidinii]|nr:unnamed protein product [[Candida] boidinii]GMG40211.1 unnamed protein product [[Candida] boidinii]
MRSNYSRNVPSSYASSERSYDVESLVSYDAAPSSRRQNNSHQQYPSSSYGGNNRNNYNNWQTFSQTYGGESDSDIQSVSGRSEVSDYYDHRMNKFFQSNSFGSIGMGGYQQQQQQQQQPPQQQQQQQYGGSGNQKFDNDIAKLTNSFSNQFTF